MMRNLARLAARLYNTALLIEPGKADAIDGVFRDAVNQRWEKPAAEPPVMELMVAATPFMRTRGGYMRSDNGIALIQVLGPLVQRGAGMDAVSGGFESYENLGKQLSTARADPMVRGILLELDSPGGEASGVADFARALRETSKEKPVIAHANEMAFSAAYWLASAAEELYAPASGMVGSVGVIMLHVDQSQMNAKRGLDVTHIKAGAHKADFSPHAPLSDEALMHAQAMVDRLYGQFVADVAQARGIDEQDVRDTEARLLDPDEAQALGMIDGTASLEQTVQRLTEVIREPSGSKRYRRAAASAQEANGPMPEETLMAEKDKGAAPEANAADAALKAQLDAAEARGVEKGVAKATSEAEAKIAKEAEAKANVDAKARVKAIMGCEEAKERPKLAAHLALDADPAPSVEAAIATLRAAAKETSGNPLDAAMRGTNPKVDAGGSGDGKGGGSGDQARVDTAGIYASRRQAALHTVK